MLNSQLKFIKANLKYQVLAMKNRGEVMDKASWMRKMGVILSGEDAEILIKYLEEQNSIK